MNKYKLIEVETGLHYLAFYIEPKPQGLQEQVYKTFCRLYPERMDIQQDRFIHEAGDVPIYHVTGCPRDDLKKKTWRHFHIRTMHIPTVQDIEDCLIAIEKHCDISDYVISQLDYPKDRDIPQESKAYLKYINVLRTNNNK